MERNKMHFILLNTKIFRNIQVYMDRVMKKYELSSGSFSYLFILEHQEGISQNKLSQILQNDKAMSARTITRLIELGYVSRKQDEDNGSAYNLYLTEHSKAILPKLHDEIQTALGLITQDLTSEELSVTMASLLKIYDNTIKLRE